MDEEEPKSDRDDEALVQLRLRATPDALARLKARPFGSRRSSGLLFQVLRKQARPAPEL